MDQFNFASVTVTEETAVISGYHTQIAGHLGFGAMVHNTPVPLCRRPRSPRQLGLSAIHTVPLGREVEEDCDPVCATPVEDAPHGRWSDGRPGRGRELGL